MAKFQALKNIINRYNFKSESLDTYKKNLASYVNEDVTPEIEKELNNRFYALPFKIWEEIVFSYKKLTDINISLLPLDAIITIKKSLEKAEFEAQILNSLDLLSQFAGSNIKEYFNELLKTNIKSTLSNISDTQLQQKLYKYFINAVIGYVDLELSTENDILQDKLSTNNKFFEIFTLYNIEEYNIKFDAIYLEYRDTILKINQFFTKTNQEMLYIDLQDLILSINNNPHLQNNIKETIKKQKKLEPHLAFLFNKLISKGENLLDDYILENFLLAREFNDKIQRKYNIGPLFGRMIELMICCNINFNPKAIYRYIGKYNWQNNLFLSAYIIFYRNNDRLKFFDISNLDKEMLEILSKLHINKNTIEDLLKITNIRIDRTKELSHELIIIIENQKLITEFYENNFLKSYLNTIEKGQIAPTIKSEGKLIQKVKQFSLKWKRINNILLGVAASIGVFILADFMFDIYIPDHITLMSTFKTAILAFICIVLGYNSKKLAKKFAWKEEKEIKIIATIYKEILGVHREVNVIKEDIIDNPLFSSQVEKVAYERGIERIFRNEPIITRRAGRL